MQPVPPVQTVFVPVYPQGRQGHPGVLESNYTLQTGLSEAGLNFVPVFTDEDAGEQWIAQEKLAGATMHNLSVPGGYIAFLRLLQAETPGHIAYDPGQGAYPVFSRATVLDQLRKSPVSPDKPGSPIPVSGFKVGPVIPYPAPEAPLEDECDPEIREVSSVVWAKIKKAMADRKARGEPSPFKDSKDQ